MLMTIARRGGVCACLLLCSLFAAAQPPTGGQVLTLPEALARTLARNPELRVLGLQREALQAQGEHQRAREEMEGALELAQSSGDDEQQTAQARTTLEII